MGVCDVCIILQAQSTLNKFWIRGRISEVHPQHHFPLMGTSFFRTKLAKNYHQDLHKSNSMSLNKNHFKCAFKIFKTSCGIFAGTKNTFGCLKSTFIVDLSTNECLHQWEWLRWIITAKIMDKIMDSKIWFHWNKL